MITIICGTNRVNSLSKKIALFYQQLLKEHDVESIILDLQDLPADFTHSALYKNSGKNKDFNSLQQLIDENEKFVFIIPEYNGSYPGVLKAFIDGLRYPSSFNNKKAAMVGLSSGVLGGAVALSHFADVLSYLGADILGLWIKLGLIEKNMENDTITNPIYNKLLRTQVERLINF